MQIPESEVLEIIAYLEKLKNMEYYYMNSIKFLLGIYKEGNIIYFHNNMAATIGKVDGDMTMHLKKIHDSMFESSETWRNYMKDKRFIIELNVFSGQADFIISRWENGVLTEYE